MGAIPALPLKKVGRGRLKENIMDRYFNNKEIINQYNDGNHVNGDAPNRYDEPEPEDECPECGTLGLKSYIKANGLCEACFQEQFKLGM